MSLIAVCYEQIHGDFWYGLIGEFRLIVDRKTGYFNATKLCDAGGKQFRFWFQNKQSRDLIEYISTNMDLLNPVFYTLKGGGTDIQNEIVSGTYVSSYLLLAIASWVSPEFYIKCNKIIMDYFIGEYKIKLMQAKQNLQEKENQAKSLKDELHHASNQVNSMKEEVRTTSEKINTIIADVAPKTKNQRLLHVFAIIEKNIDENCISSIADSYPYTTVRVQKRTYTRAIEELKGRYQKARVISTMAYNPNSVNLFNHIKEKITYVKTRYNDFRLENVSIGEFITDINNLIHSKI